MKRILPLFIFLTIISCAPRITPEETVTLILDLIEREDYGALDDLAPLFSELTASERDILRQGLMPFIEEKPFLEVKKQGFNKSSVILYTPEKESRAIIMTLLKNQGAWVLSENISYTQKIGFIPAVE